MRQKAGVRPTIGFLSTWSVYEGTAIDSYTHTLFQGICAAAREHDCDLLLGCGMSLPASPRASRTVWPVLGEGADFCPVGPWNTDGLIIIPDDLSDAQFEYVQDLIRSGYPIVLTTAEKPGPLVAVDNAAGIRQAFDHLWQHGHRRFAFIAGKSGRGGDTMERLAAFREAQRDAGIEEDRRLIAFGEHRREDGRRAMEKILSSGAAFTSLLASNDLSALGAMEVLHEAGRRVPEDVAVVGFDDILEARSHLPPLTTVRHPTFRLGVQTVLSLLDAMEGRRMGEAQTRVPTRLVIRQSCGCRPETAPARALPETPVDLLGLQGVLARTMAEATLVEARHSTRQEFEELSLQLTGAFAASLASGTAGPFDTALQHLVGWLDGRGEDAYSWHAALSNLRRGLSRLAPLIPGASPLFGDSLIDRARLEIAELAQRQATYALLRHMEMSSRLGLMTSQLLAAPDASASARILDQHLPHLGIDHALVALYAPQEDDPCSLCTVLLAVGLPEDAVGRQFRAREFPPAGLYPADRAHQLAILPLVVDDQTTGFVAFSATNLEPCAGILHNLASALRSGRLYRDAVEGQRLAEEANRLKSRFLSVVSHELRTPLSLIVGLSDMILREHRDKPQLSEVTMHDMEQIYASAQHLGQLIGDVLDLASSEAGQLRLLREPLDLAEVLGAAAKIGEQMAQARGLAWRSSFPQQGLWVLGDRTRLRQVVLNLINNAIKFTTSGTVVLQVETDEQGATVSVSDTGVGVPPSEQESVFREFHRSERTVQWGYGGLGLGLAICKYLVEQHGGTIGVRSPGDLGSGSTFFFTLPVIPAPGTETDQDLLPLPRTGCVAVLSQHAETGDSLAAYLCERGFEVQVVHIDQEPDWLMHLLAVRPAALVLDQETATRHGWALLERLKRQLSTEQVPVLVYSLDLEQDRGEWLELNVLPKPLASEELVEQLARYVDSKERVVLIVDDDPGVLDLHGRLVEQTGCRAVCARSGRAALEILEYTQPDLILLDLMMPEVDGFAVLDALRARETTRDIPVIVLRLARLTKRTSSG